MFRKLTVFFVFLFFFFFKFGIANSQEEFSVDSFVTYEVLQSGKTVVTHDITLENNFSTLYATSYSLTLENIQALGVSARSEGNDQLSVDSQIGDEKTVIKVSFNDAVVGKGNTRHFFVTYENSEFAVRTGEVWEVSVPKLSDNENFRNYEVTLKVPDSLGFEAYVSPKPSEHTGVDGYKIYRFTKEALLKTGVTAGFGEFQVFSYTLNYHLENPLPKTAQTEIALPPDTAFQKVYIKSLSPQPKNIIIDPDGNWLAIYQLSARERVDVVATGLVQIFSSERPFPMPTQETLDKNLKATEHWQVDDIEIKALAGKLQTPRAIYDYVSSTLNYDYDRVKPNIERLGAKGALLSPSSAICMEFTDLFIAIARAAGIPAREINGYAYTENPEIQPLSLVADVLHSWPEYWDEERKAWIPIDPTWASTTGGVNFFDKLDLRHFSFVIHGEDSSKPYPPGSYKLGSNPQKDVFVSFGKLSDEPQNYPDISASFNESLPFLNSSLKLKVKNTGPTAFYALSPYVYFDKTEFYRDFIEVMPPFSEYETSVPIPYSLLGANTPNEIIVEVDGSRVTIPTNKNRVIIQSLVAIFILFIVILLIILWRHDQLKFLKYLGSIRFGKAKPQSTSEKQST
jgi:hypothetical protein